MFDNQVQRLLYTAFAITLAHRMPSRAAATDFYAVGRPTTLLRPERLSDRLGVDVLLATETFQRTGSFKFRAAYAVATQAPQAEILTASSGNFGLALAEACRLTGKRCTVVMPANAVAVKVNGIRALGAEVDLVDTAKTSRQQRVAELAAQRPQAFVASAYDDPVVIAGNSTLGRELAEQRRAGAAFDAVLVPVGGGGLSAGLLQGLRAAGDDTPVFGAEPALRGVAAASLARREIVASPREVQSIADGARTLALGRHNWGVLKDALAGIVGVGELHIAEAVRLLFALANLKAEPTGALALGALLAEPERFRGQAVCCVVTGGNADPELYSRILRNEL